MSGLIDVTETVRSWGNAQSALVGAGRPLALGFHRRRPRSPGRGCFALVDAAVDSRGGLDAEGTISHTTVTFRVFSATDIEAARAAAVATVEALQGMNASRPVVDGVRLLMVADVSFADGTNESASGDDEPLYIVRADIYAA